MAGDDDASEWTDPNSRTGKALNGWQRKVHAAELAALAIQRQVSVATHCPHCLGGGGW